MASEIVNARVVGTRTTVRVRVAKGADERDPIECPACGHVAQWRGTVYRCKAGHEARLVRD